MWHNKALHSKATRHANDHQRVCLAAKDAGMQATSMNDRTGISKNVQ